MKKMLVLLNRPEDIDNRLLELREISIMHGVTRVYLASVSHAFSSRVRSIIAPHKLDLAAQISEAAASRYLTRIAGELGTESIDVEPISARMPSGELNRFIEKNKIDLVVTSDGHSGLCRWAGAKITGRHVRFICEHVVGQCNLPSRTVPCDCTKKA